MMAGNIFVSIKRFDRAAVNSLFAKVRGAVGRKAARIETKFETVISPKALTDVVTNLYTVLGVKVTVVV
jgi:hypothetical protein